MNALAMILSRRAEAPHALTGPLVDGIVGLASTELVGLTEKLSFLARFKYALSASRQPRGGRRHRSLGGGGLRRERPREPRRPFTAAAARTRLYPPLRQVRNVGDGSRLRSRRSGKLRADPRRDRPLAAALIPPPTATSAPGRRASKRRSAMGPAQWARRLGSIRCWTERRCSGRRSASTVRSIRSTILSTAYASTSLKMPTAPGAGSGGIHPSRRRHRQPDVCVRDPHSGRLRAPFPDRHGLGCTSRMGRRSRARRERT
ncbi:hypothetical protein SAMN05443247_11636 [Bradyrhizobium erythrophlei]|nr:hypothetical protein SAMN05443247_11636 [Bradyrhizobium erythrophlei]